MGRELRESSTKELLLWLLRKRWRLRVTGVSMLPLLQPGEEILVDTRAYKNELPKLGDLVVAKHPHLANLRLIKRVSKVFEDGSCFLKGDNALASTDSRSFGLVDSQQILGRVTSRFP
ncbi:MAG: nickel-type superoxide dismutase maturation protease [Spirulinaceae cyanobacterium]